MRDPATEKVCFDMTGYGSIVVAESHEIIREAVVDQIKLNCDFERVASASDGYSTLKLVRSLNPDVILLDLSFAHPNAIEVLERIKKSSPASKVIAISSERNFNRALAVFALGAVGFLFKKATGKDFVNAVEAARAGYSQLPIAFAREFVKSGQNAGRTGNPFGISARELEILEAYLRGDTTQQIAENLNISTRTVDTHRNNIFKKTGTNSQKALVNIARTWHRSAETP